MQNLKEQLPKTDPNKQSALIAKSINDAFLKNQIADNTFYGKKYNKYGTGGTPVFSWIKTDEMKREYERRVNNMFADVSGMGDMHEVVDPHFALTDKMNQYFDMGALNGMKQIMTRDVTNAGSCYDRAYFDLIQRVDEDGVRTLDEQAEIDEFVGGKVRVKEVMAQNGKQANSYTDKWDYQVEESSVHLEKVKTKDTPNSVTVGSKDEDKVDEVSMAENKQSTTAAVLKLRQNHGR